MVVEVLPVPVEPGLKCGSISALYCPDKPTHVVLTMSSRSPRFVKTMCSVCVCEVAQTKPSKHKFESIVPLAPPPSLPLAIHLSTIFVNLLAGPALTKPDDVHTNV